MGFLDELKKLTRPYSDEDEDDFSEYDEDETAAPEEDAQPAPRPARRSIATAQSADTANYGSASGVSRRDSNNRVVNIHTTAQLQVVLVKPERFDNVSEVADHLREKHAVLLNLEHTDKNVARRLVDFLSGCAYALDGKIKKVAASTYIITPFNVDIVGDLVEELENSGMYF